MSIVLFERSRWHLLRQQTEYSLPIYCIKIQINHYEIVNCISVVIVTKFEIIEARFNNFVTTAQL